MAEFLMPILGADMTAGTLVEWRKQPGDAVRRGDIIALVETDKADVEVEVFTSGVIERLLVGPGTEVPVGTPLAIIHQEGEAAASQPAASATTVPLTPAARGAPGPMHAGAGTPPQPVGPAAQPVPHRREAALGRLLVAPAARRLAEERGIDLATVTGTGPDGRIQLRDVERAAARGAHVEAASQPPTAPHLRASPLARELAADLGVDLAAVHGTGIDGRIMRHDVEEAAAAARARVEAPAAPAPPPLARPATPPDRQARMRLAIAAAMERSNREIPQFQLLTTIDMKRALDWLTETNTERPVAARLLYGVLLIKAVALALREVPELNATWQDGCVQLKPDIHVGVAIVLRGGGLVAPALHDVDHLTLDELMHDFRDLVQRARAFSLRSSEMTDPTITITSLGEQGVETVFGLIYPPQVAIVGFGKIVERPWSVEGQIVSRPLLTATLSADHRAVDGHRGGVFLNAVDRLLQEPDKL